MMPWIMGAVFALVFVFRVRSGWRRGAIREFFSLLKFVLALICLWLVWIGYTFIRGGDFFKLIIPAGGIGIITYVFRLVGKIGYTLTGLREAGPVRLVDSLVGALIGAAEALLLLWFMKYFLNL